MGKNINSHAQKKKKKKLGSSSGLRIFILQEFQSKIECWICYIIKKKLQYIELFYTYKLKKLISIHSRNIEMQMKIRTETNLQSNKPAPYIETQTNSHLHAKQETYQLE